MFERTAPRRRTSGGRCRFSGARLRPHCGEHRQASTGPARRRAVRGARVTTTAAIIASGAIVGAAPSPVAATAQTRVEGEVLDVASGVPVAGVIVHFPDLGLGTISDEMGYFSFDAVPRGSQVLATHHAGYMALLEAVPIVEGESWVLRLTPRPVLIDGVTVEAARAEELEAARSGRRADFINATDVADAGGRTNKVLEVLRTKAPPRMQIRQQGGRGGVTFCIQSTRRAPSVQELTDLGIGCHPALLVLDGVVVYSPPTVTEMARAEPPSLPGDVAALLLNQNPNEIETIRILSRTDAFFRYGEVGRLGAVEIRTRHPGRPRG